MLAKSPFLTFCDVRMIKRVKVLGRHLSLISYCLFGLPLLAQEKSAATEIDADTNTPRNAVFIEAGGSGLWYSLNYERIIFSSQSLRIGVAYLGEVAFPALYNVMLGSETHKLEIGIGATFLFGTKPADRNRLYATGNLSYRWAFSTETGLNFLRLSFTPFLGDLAAGSAVTSFVPWGGISVGTLY